MRRREFFAVLGRTAAALGGTIAVRPFRASAQQRLRRIGLLLASSPSDPASQYFSTALKEGLHGLGWIEGSNVELEIRYSAVPETLPASVAELLAANVDVIVVGSAGMASIVQQATRDIPIITMTAGDLVGTGLAQSLRRPGGNVTGNQILSPELMGKRVELIRELVPQLERLGLVEPITPAGIIAPNHVDMIITSAKTLGIDVHRVEFRRSTEIASVFAAMAERRDGAALVLANPLSVQYRREIASAAARSRLPTIYEVRAFVTAGGLVSYGAELSHLYRRSAAFIDKVLKGVPPGELPIEQPTKFELVINLKTAKALGLEIPPTLLARADEVIE
jgi:putative ABC transport system substrate-binding protein